MLSSHKSDITVCLLACLFCFLFLQVCADVMTLALSNFPSMNLIQMNYLRQNLNNETWHFTFDLRQIIIGAITSLPQERGPELRA